MFSNYIASKIDHEEMDNYQIKIDGKIYTYYGNDDPEYQNDGVLDISYWTLYDEDDEPTNMVYAFDHIDCDEPNEWSDEYDNPHVLFFN